jgi:hypothetical protein
MKVITTLNNKEEVKKNNLFNALLGNCSARNEESSEGQLQGGFGG